MSRLAVRTLVRLDRDGWSVVVRVEEPAGTPSTLVPEIVIGPFKTAVEADAKGKEVAKEVRIALKMEKN